MRKYARNLNFVREILETHDFIGIQEAHSMEGRVKAFDNEFNLHFRSFWSHLSPRQGGVGLILTLKFLQQFDPDPVWTDIVPGRVARLRLRGPCGSLDIFVCYLDARDRNARQECATSVLPFFSDQKEVLTLLFGDFNFVISNHDRLNKISGDWSGQANQNESNWFSDHFFSPANLAEWAQSEHTCEISSARSRIDRFYCNLHIGAQQNEHVECCALDWKLDLSSHRPIHFAKLHARKKRKTPRPLPLWTVDHPKFSSMVEELYDERLRYSGGNEIMDRMMALKRSVRDVCFEIERMFRSEPASNIEQKKSCSLKLVRLLQRRDFASAPNVPEQYPFLSTFCF